MNKSTVEVREYVGKLFKVFKRLEERDYVISYNGYDYTSVELMEIAGRVILNLNNEDRQTVKIFDSSLDTRYDLAGLKMKFYGKFVVKKSFILNVRNLDDNDLPEL